MSRRLADHQPTPPARRESDAAVVAVVALGANLGNREETLAQAVRDIARLPLVDDIQVVEPIETVAVTLTGESEDAPRYLNSVALVTTRLAPSILLGYLHGIEKAHGRERGERWGDRTLDLDLITYGDVESTNPKLTLPHPRAHEREFVLAPWLVADADAMIPGHGRVDELLRDLRGSGPA